MNKNNTLVRRYEMRDIGAICALGVQYIPELPNYKGISVDSSRIKFLLESNINNDGAYMVYVLVDQDDKIVGCIAAYCVTLLFSWEKVTNDIFLFITPEYRTTQNASELVQAYINWARARKVNLICASQASGYRDPLLRKFITSFGFVEVGSLYHLRTDGETK